MKKPEKCEICGEEWEVTTVNVKDVVRGRCEVAGWEKVCLKGKVILNEW